MERIKSLLKPLEDDTAIMVGRRKEMFPYEDELKQHLDCLGVPELSDRLVWIPFNRIQNATLLAQGGFSKAWKARIKLRKGGVVQQVVLKELDKSAIQQVRMFPFWLKRSFCFDCHVEFYREGFFILTY